MRSILKLYSMDILTPYTLIIESHPKFSILLNELLEKAEILPIYSAAHKNYYDILYKKQKVRDYSFLLIDNERAVGAFLGYEFNGSPENKNLSYFGMPCLFVLLPDFKTDLKLHLSHHMIKQLIKNRFIEKYVELDFEIIFPFHSVIAIESIEKLIRAARKHQIFYERAINLLEEETQLFANLSKSAKSAIKKVETENVRLTLFDKNSTKSEQSFAISILRKLHFESAGRKTRSDESWNEQSLQLQQGSILVTHGNINNETVHSSLFLLNGRSAYYGVSANKIDTSRTSISHYFLYQTIIELKKRGFAILFMGRQYESLEKSLSHKEEGIEQFKSFFGGGLRAFLGFSSND